MGRRSIAGAPLAVLLLVVTLGAPVRAENPVITNIYTADPAAMLHNGTVYLYTGHDEAPAGGTNFVMRDWHVFSSTDMTTWTAHGARLSLATFPWAGADAWASQVVQRNGRFYWYVSVNGNGPGWMNIGVAVGDSPLGPFTDAIGGPLVSDSTPNSAPLNIDPTVFVDDDGQASSTGVRSGAYEPPG